STLDMSMTIAQPSELNRSADSMSLAQDLPLRTCSGRSERRPPGCPIVYAQRVSYGQTARPAAGTRGRPPAGCRRHEMRRSRVRITSMVGVTVGALAGLRLAA